MVDRKKNMGLVHETEELMTEELPEFDEYVLDDNPGAANTKYSLNWLVLALNINFMC